MAKHKRHHPVGLQTRKYPLFSRLIPTNFPQSTASLLIHIMPHRYMKLPNMKWIISVMFLSTTNIPPTHYPGIHDSHINKYPPCTVHNEAQHRRVDTSQYLNELISNSESQKPTQQFKIQSSNFQFPIHKQTHMLYRIDSSKMNTRIRQT